MFRRTLAGILAPVIALAGFYLWGRTHPYTVTTSTEIAAPAARVWDVLAGLGAYHHWNPEITDVSGRAAVGERLTLRVRSRQGAQTVHATVRAVVPGRELRWSRRYNDLGRLADSEQRFTIEPAGPDRVRFTQEQTFRGIAVPFIHGTLAGECEHFADMNAARKKRAESGE